MLGLYLDPLIIGHKFAACLLYKWNDIANEIAKLHDK